MIDTHTHIYLEEFDGDRDQVMQHSMESGVSHLVFPNVDLSTIAPMHKLHEQYPEYTSMAMGLHPTEVTADNTAALRAVEHQLPQHPYVAIGEIGIDLYWDATYRQQQMQVLDTQLHWAAELGLPFIIHCRNGFDETLEVFKKFSGTLPNGVFHSFTGTADDIRHIRECGDFYFGINGIVTFKKSHLPSLLPLIGIDRLLLETDSPYLAPVPNRGRRNESANIPHINNCIAGHLALSPEEVSQRTDSNARTLFKI